MHYGSWFEHIKGWLSCREEQNLFYLTYEELHQVSSGLRSCSCTGSIKAWGRGWGEQGQHMALRKWREMLV